MTSQSGTSAESSLIVSPELVMCFEKFFIHGVSHSMVPVRPRIHLRSTCRVSWWILPGPAGVDVPGSPPRFYAYGDAKERDPAIRRKGMQIREGLTVWHRGIKSSSSVAMKIVTLMGGLSDLLLIVKVQRAMWNVEIDMLKIYHFKRRKTLSLVLEFSSLCGLRRWTSTF